MGKGYQSRKENIKAPKKKILIVCEGKKTERLYFDGFKTRNSGVEILTPHGKCTNPKNIVDFAEYEMKKESIDFDEGDSVWCVFDVDENSNSVLKDTSDHAKKLKIKIALSNPCFELWYLLHYKQHSSEIFRDDVIKELKMFIKDYEKNKSFNHILQSNQQVAIERTKKLNALHEKNKHLLFSRESNPSSQVFQLVEYIKYLTEENKKI